MYSLSTHAMAMDIFDLHFLRTTGLPKKTLNKTFYLSKDAPYFHIKISFSACTSKNGKKQTYTNDCPYEASGPKTESML